MGLEDLEEELAFEVNFTKNLTLYSLAMHKAYSSYIKKKLAMGISNSLSLSPTTVRLIKKREKVSKTLKLSSQLAIEKLFKKKQAELNKTRPTSERQV